MRYKGRYRVSKHTVCGVVELVRKYMQSGKGKQSFQVDALVDVLYDTYSAGVREMCCRTNRGSSSFEQAAGNLHRTAEFKLSAETVRKIVSTEGQAIVQQQGDGTLLPQWKATDCQIQTPGGATVTRVYCSMDGVLTPMVTDHEKRLRRAKALRKRRAQRASRPRALRLPLAPRRLGSDRRWKESKVIGCYSQGLRSVHMAATCGKRSMAGRILLRETTRIGFMGAAEALALVDGAPWIRKQIRARRVQVEFVGLDFYHLSEHVHAACNVVYGMADAQEQVRTGKAESLLHIVRHEGYKPFIDALIAWRAATRSPRKRGSIEKLMGYAVNHEDMIRYPMFEQHGWHIGSGPVESMCGVVPKRLKGGGKKWDAPNAEAIMAIECMARSDQWHRRWPNVCSLAA